MPGLLQHPTFFPAGSKTRMASQLGPVRIAHDEMPQVGYARLPATSPAVTNEDSAQCALLRFRAGNTDDLAPFLGFRLHEGRKVGAEGGARLGAEFADAGADLRTLDDLFGLLNEPRHHWHRRARSPPRADPRRGENPGEPLFAHGWQVWQRRWPARAGFGEPAALAGADLRQVCGQEIEEHLHVPADQVVHGRAPPA